MNRDALPIELFVSLLVLWAGAAVYAILTVDTSGTAPVAVALLGLVVAASFAAPFRGAGALTGLLAALAYAGLQVFREISQSGGVSVTRFALIFGFAVLVAITVVLAAAVTNRIASTYTTLRRNLRLIDELTMRDAVTGAIKKRYADQILVEEIQRARRFARVLSVGLVSIEGTDRILEERGRDGLEQVYVQIGSYLVTTLRTIDKVSRHDRNEFALILPETKLEGAQIISERLIAGLAADPGVTARIGLAEFPSDAATAEDLIREAHQALDFAKAVQLRVASRNLLEGELASA